MRRLFWVATVLLVSIGVAAATGRVIFAGDLITRFEPARQWIFGVLHVSDPFAAGRAAEVAFVDGRFSAHRTLTLLHVVPGGLFVLLAPLQFSKRIRSRYIALHRWSGRVLLPAAIVSVISSLYFGVGIPYGGPGEAVMIGLMAALFLVSAVRAFIAIRRKEVARHREWMIRCFAVALSISTVRLMGGPLDLMLTPAGFRAPEVFVIAIWTGVALTVGVAELWIRRTRAGQPSRSNHSSQTSVAIDD